MIPFTARASWRSPILRASRRALVWPVALSLMLMVAVAPPLIAGPGHDHGPAAAAGAAAPPSPRAIANSESYQFVGIVEGEVLVIYLDRFATNAPVTEAELEVTIGDQAHKAELQKNSTYEVSSPLLRTAGEHAVLVSIQESAASDLLVTSVAIPDAAGATAAASHTLLSHLPFALRPMQAGGIAAGGLLILIAAGGFAQAPRRRPAAIAAMVGLGIIAASSVYAHEGHDHGPAGNAGNGNAPQRLPDGNVFLPKPTQRLLEVRTRILEPETAARTVRFQGRIVANPNRSGVVQSTIQGRFSAPEGGVPFLGARVRAGDLMGRVAPSFASKETSDMAQSLAEIDQQITLSRTRLGRLEQLLRSNVASQVSVDEARVQLNSYLKRRQELLDSRVQPEELRAPVDGVISAIRVVSGQVVSQTDQLFQIIDPSSFFVEALMFDQSGGDQIGDAVASFGDGKTAKLKFLGRSRSLQQQYSVLKFELENPGADLNVGTPVIVVGSTGQTITGLRLPRSAVAQAPNGQMVVFVHKDAEIFEPRAVRFEPFDAETVLVSAGVDKGDKVVVQNAPLVNQVR